MAASNLYQRNGTWYVRVQIEGRDYRKSLMTRSKAEAERRSGTAIERATMPAHPTHQRLRRVSLVKELAAHSRATSFGNFIYFIQREDGGRIKIGRSEKPEARIAKIQENSSSLLKVLCCVPAPIKYELEIHRRFARERVYREWFLPSQRLRKFIRDILELKGGRRTNRIQDNGLMESAQTIEQLSD